MGCWIHPEALVRSMGDSPVRPRASVQLQAVGTCEVGGDVEVIPGQVGMIYTYKYTYVISGPF